MKNTATMELISYAEAFLQILIWLVMLSRAAFTIMMFALRFSLEDTEK